MLLCTGVLAAAAAPANATGQPASDAWQFDATAYLWAAGIDSETAGGAEVSVSSDTLLDNLHMAFMGTLEARRGPWSALADVIYLNAGVRDGGTVPVRLGSGPGVPVDVSATVETRGWVLQALGGYTLWQTPKASLDLVAGVRYLELRLDFGLRLAVDAYRLSRAWDTSSVLWDGVIGVRGHVDLNPSWYVPYHLDAGTGDSDLTWQASLGLGHRFDWGDVTLAYRHIAWDPGPGSPIAHIDFSGPLLAARFRF
jgi:hypothetical protein